MKTKIKFYSGLDTIGGVVMSIVYGKERILLEIGSAFDPAKEVIKPNMEKRIEHYLYDELCLNKVPLVEGLYSKKHLKGFDLLASEDCDLHTSIFITHLHLDHMACMGLVSDDVDIYVSEPLLRIEKALEAVNKGVHTLHSGNYKILDPNKEYQIGEMILKPFLLNDKSYQDYSFYVKTPDMKLHYTGDVVLHGRYSDNVWKEMEYIKNEHVDVLVCETTSLMDNTMEMLYGEANAEIVACKDLPDGMLDTAMVDQKLLERLEQLDGLAVLNFYEREMEDVERFNHMAKQTGRIPVYEPETAYIIWKYFNEPVNVYVPDYTYEQDWFTELMENNPQVTLQQIHQNPRGYLLQNTYEHSMELFDLPKGGYLHSGGMPIGAFDPAFANLQRILKLAGFEHIGFFMSNYFTHAYPSQLKYYCDQVDAKVLIPSHGRNPERLLASNGRQRLLPKLYQTYVLENDQLVEAE